MNTLPYDLRWQVCGDLGPTSLKSVREANKGWAQIAASFLFREVQFTLSTFQKLIDLSQHETLRLDIRSIVLCPDRLPYVLPEDWHRACLSKFAECTVQQIGSKYERYVKLYREEQRMVSLLGPDMSILREHHQSVVHLTHDTIVQAITPFSKLKTIKSVTLTGPRSNFRGSLPRSIEGWSDVWRDLDSLQLKKPYDFFHCAFWPLEMIYLLRLPVAKSITNIKAEAVPDVIWGFSELHSNPLWQESFAYLVDLDLEMNGYTFLLPTPLRKELQVRAFSKAIGKAKKLEKLVLRVYPFIQPWRRSHAVDTLRYFRLHLPALRRLELWGFNAHATSLQEFLHHYRESLRFVALHDLCLMSEVRPDEWFWLIQKLVSDVWHLEDIHLQNLLYGDFHSPEVVEESDLRATEGAIAQRVRVN